LRDGDLGTGSGEEERGWEPAARGCRRRLARGLPGRLGLEGRRGGWPGGGREREARGAAEGLKNTARGQSTKYLKRIACRGQSQC
jgi:hypothetical protein